MSTKAEGKNSILLKSALQNHPYPMLGLWKVKAKDNDGKICFPTLALPNHILSYAKIAKIYQYNKQQQQPFISFHHTYCLHRPLNSSTQYSILSKHSAVFWLLKQKIIRFI